MDRSYWNDLSLKEIKIALVAAYLEHHGWNKITQPNDRILLYEGELDDSGNPIRVILPSSHALEDSHLRLAEIIKVLGVIYKKPPTVILGEIESLGENKLKTVQELSPYTGKVFFRTDFLSGISVFLVSLPLCLGIALASGAPLLAGIISGVVGGVIVGSLSKSPLSITGPAAGLAAIILTSVQSLGSYSNFLLAVALAGLMQILLGTAKSGAISKYISSGVIEGMLTAVGIIVILKQFPFVIGNDGSWEQDGIHFGVVIIALACFSTLIALNQVHRFSVSVIGKILPASLISVVVGTIINEIFKARGSRLAIPREHLVNLPVLTSFSDIPDTLTMPDITAITNPKVWITAITLALIASIETLLCIEGADKLDPLGRRSNTDAELTAQGFGNFVCGLIGGIPMTSVIVRTSVNVYSGAITKASSITQGCLLLLTVLMIPSVLNKIPLACFAAIMMMIGVKLAHPYIFQKMYRRGSSHFVPFIVTIIAIVYTDLLMGIAFGQLVSIAYVFKNNQELAKYFVSNKHQVGRPVQINLAPEMTPWNKKAVIQALESLPNRSEVVIDASKSSYIDSEVLKIIEDFARMKSKEKDITVKLVGFKEDYLHRIEPRYA